MRRLLASGLLLAGLACASFNSTDNSTAPSGLRKDHAMWAIDALPDISSGYQAWFLGIVESSDLQQKLLWQQSVVNILWVVSKLVLNFLLKGHHVSRNSPIQLVIVPALDTAQIVVITLFNGLVMFYRSGLMLINGKDASHEANVKYAKAVSYIFPITLMSTAMLNIVYAVMTWKGVMESFKDQTMKARDELRNVAFKWELRQSKVKRDRLQLEFNKLVLNPQNSGIMAALNGTSNRRAYAILQELGMSHDMIDDDISYVDLNCTEYLSCKRSARGFSLKNNPSRADCGLYIPKPYGSIPADPSKGSLARQRTSIVYDVDSEKTILPPQAITELEKLQGKYCVLLWQKEWLPPYLRWTLVVIPMLTMITSICANLAWEAL